MIRLFFSLLLMSIAVIELLLLKHRFGRCTNALEVCKNLLLSKNCSRELESSKIRIIYPLEAPPSFLISSLSPHDWQTSLCLSVNRSILAARMFIVLAGNLIILLSKYVFSFGGKHAYLSIHCFENKHVYSCYPFETAFVFPEF